MKPTENPNYKRQLPSECVAGAIANCLWYAKKIKVDSQELDNRLRKELNIPERTGINPRLIIHLLKQWYGVNVYVCDDVLQIREQLKYGCVLFSRPSFVYNKGKKFKMVNGVRYLNEGKRKMGKRHSTCAICEDENGIKIIDTSSDYVYYISVEDIYELGSIKGYGIT